MVARITTVAFQGIEAVPVDVQVLMTPGKPSFTIVGLPDKAVAESRERVHAALHASGLALPPKRITVNLAPADLPEGGQPLRPADRARADGGDGRGRRPTRSASMSCSASWRSTGAITAGRRRAAGGDRRERARARADLPGRLRAGGGLGGRGARRHRAATA